MALIFALFSMISAFEADGDLNQSGLEGLQKAQLRFRTALDFFLSANRDRNDIGLFDSAYQMVEIFYAPIFSDISLPYRARKKTLEEMSQLLESKFLENQGIIGGEAVTHLKEEILKGIQYYRNHPRGMRHRYFRSYLYGVASYAAIELGARGTVLGAKFSYRGIRQVHDFSSNWISDLKEYRNRVKSGEMVDWAELRKKRYLKVPAPQKDFSPYPVRTSPRERCKRILGALKGLTKRTKKVLFRVAVRGIPIGIIEHHWWLKEHEDEALSEYVLSHSVLPSLNRYQQKLDGMSPRSIAK